MVRCMLKEKNWPKALWGYVDAYVVYLLNKFPTNIFAMSHLRNYGVHTSQKFITLEFLTV